jgi:hypothetical protein
LSIFSAIPFSQSWLVVVFNHAMKSLHSLVANRATVLKSR